MTRWALVNPTGHVIADGTRRQMRARLHMLRRNGRISGYRIIPLPRAQETPSQRVEREIAELWPD